MFLPFYPSIKCLKRPPFLRRCMLHNSLNIHIASCAGYQVKLLKWIRQFAPSAPRDLPAEKKGNYRQRSKQNVVPYVLTPYKYFKRAVFKYKLKY